MSDIKEYKRLYIWREGGICYDFYTIPFISRTGVILIGHFARADFSGPSQAEHKNVMCGDARNFKFYIQRCLTSDLKVKAKYHAASIN